MTFWQIRKSVTLGQCQMKVKLDSDRNEERDVNERERQIKLHILRLSKWSPQRSCCTAWSCGRSRGRGSPWYWAPCWGWRPAARGAAPPPGCGRCPARASARQPATRPTQTRLSSVGSVKHQSWIFCPDGVRRGTLAGEQLSLTDLLSSKMILISCLLFVCLFYLVKNNYRPIVHSWLQLRLRANVLSGKWSGIFVRSLPEQSTIHCQG